MMKPTRLLSSTLACIALALTGQLVSATPAHADSGEVTMIWHAANGAILGTEVVAIISVSGCQALSPSAGAASTRVTNATDQEINVYSNTNCTGTETTVQSLSIQQLINYSVGSFNVP